MTCDCEALAAAIAVDQAEIIVAQAAVTVANQTLTAKQMQLWYDQYNFYLCGCGGEGSWLAERKSTLEEIVARDKTMPDALRTNEAMFRLHQLVMAEIGKGA